MSKQKSVYTNLSHMNEVHKQNKEQLLNALSDPKNVVARKGTKPEEPEEEPEEEQKPSRKGLAPGQKRIAANINNGGKEKQKAIPAYNPGEEINKSKSKKKAYNNLLGGINKKTTGNKKKTSKKKKKR